MVDTIGQKWLVVFLYSIVAMVATERRWRYWELGRRSRPLFVSLYWWH